MLGDKEEQAESSVPTGSPLVGVALTMGGVAMTALQYVYEEKVMSGDVQAPPWLLIGMEGGCGVLLCVFVLYPLAYLCPGSDHGSFEHPGNTLRPRVSLRAIGRPRAPKAQAAPLFSAHRLRRRPATISHHLPPSPARLPRHVLLSSWTAMLLVFVYTASIFILNALSVLITFMMSSVWHAILDSFRPVSVWLCELALFYVISGEPSPSP